MKFHVEFDCFVDRKKIIARLKKKQLKVLGQTGAYARKAMQRSIRPPKASKRSRTVVVDGQALFVPAHGLVVDAKTGNPVRTALADKARSAMAAKQRKEGAGKPPRRGKSDLLRQNIFFGVDLEDETVRIGPRKFAKQPQGLVHVESVPQLLEEGGVVRIKDLLVKYEPHPFVQPVKKIAYNKMCDILVKTPL